MKFSDMYPSAYFGKADVENGPVRATIADVRIETISSGAASEDKPVLIFAEPELKKFILNTTNGETIRDAYGGDDPPTEWRGKPIELYLDPGVVYAGKRVGGVRVRVPGSGIPRPAGNGMLSWSKAQALAAEAGIDKAALVAELQAAGRTEYNMARDTALVHQIIAAASSPQESFGEDSEVPLSDDDIPF